MKFRRYILWWALIFATLQAMTQSLPDTTTMYSHCAMSGYLVEYCDYSDRESVGWVYNRNEGYYVRVWDEISWEEFSVLTREWFVQIEGQRYTESNIRMINDKPDSLNVYQLYRKISRPKKYTNTIIIDERRRWFVNIQLGNQSVMIIVEPFTK